jgi:hypothetical protein
MLLDAGKKSTSKQNKQWFNNESMQDEMSKSVFGTSILNGRFRICEKKISYFVSSQILG